jgi:NAD(P)-dependent dehydrogenase (short-subunit alcohol dehydrogenase family)
MQNPIHPLNRIIDCRPSLTGKVAFVTGGFRGIGRECVLALLAHGTHVAFTYAEGHESAAAAEQLVAQNPEHLSAHPLDLRAGASIQRCLEQALARWQRLDILINNAAVGSATVAAYADTPAEQDSAMLTINADGTLKVCQTFLSLMHAQLKITPLKMINLSSVGGGVQTFPGFRLSDGMSKAAVAFLTRQLAAELTDTLVDVFAVCPGATNTAMFQASTLNHLTPPERQAFAESLPKGRLIDPSEIANIIVFLASGYSTPLHGAVLDASMGLGVRPGLITEKGH